MSKNIKTFRALIIKDRMNANDIAQLVKINGTLYRNSWGAWEASRPGEAGPTEEIEAALNELADYASAAAHGDMQAMEQFYEGSIHHPLDNFGFTVGDNEELFVEETPVQHQEDLIAQLKSDLADAKSKAEKLKAQLNEISTWTGFDDVDEELIPIELDIALQVYSSAIKNYNPKTGKMDNDQTTKKWLRHKTTEFFEEEQGNAVYERIATVANWKKDAGRPRKN